jgi:Dyp-type peroxidase family
METVEREDIQGIVATGYGKLVAAYYLLLAIDDPRLTGSWLASETTVITTARTGPGTDALNVAFTHAGLRRLGLSPDALAGFSDEFVEGMCTPHRSRILGDEDDNSPEHWRWGGPTTTPVDVLVMLFACDNGLLEDRYRAMVSTLPSGGLREIDRLDTSNIGMREHFGFADGISQPVLQGLGGGGPMDTVATGEFLLGYRNEYGLYTARPTFSRELDRRHVLPSDPSDSKQVDLGRNGSYLVFRQLRQDVRGFWRFLDGATKRPDGASDPGTRTHLAAKMVGRWPSGAPLVKAPDRDDPQLASANEFGYFNADRLGFACPIGAHIRRSNPRDSLDPNPGSASSLEVNRRHRLLRRGREYGPGLTPEEAVSSPVAPDDPERGLHFICLNGNVSRQFEFIQHTWANDPRFNGLYDDHDPITGPHTPSGATFTMQAHPARKRIRGLPQFVSARGGAYFFLPGIRAVRYLSGLTT